MIAWTKDFQKKRKLVAYFRLVRSRLKYFDHYGLSKSVISRKPGYQLRIAGMRNKHEQKRCFILGNGPSLANMNLAPLKDEITIGSNGIYKWFDRWGFTTDYLLFEDIEQTEIRGPEIQSIKGPVKMCALYNAYALGADVNTIFFNSPRVKKHEYYWKPPLYPQFSKDFASVVHLGSTVTYIGLQLAYHLGCNPVYLVGVDHNYGSLPDYFPPGKITVDEDNLKLVQQCHFDPNYYKIGDTIGVPYTRRQEQAYSAAKSEFEAIGRKVYNAGIDSHLKVFERTVFNDLF